MKRSDMVRQMELFIQECKKDKFNQYETMDALLDMLEEFGMLPPERTDNKENPTGYGGGWLEDAEVFKNVFNWKHNWETEGE